MGQFHHPNVLKLHGVVTVGEPVRKLNLSLAFHQLNLAVLYLLSSGNDSTRTDEKWGSRAIPAVTKAKFALSRVSHFVILQCVLLLFIAIFCTKI